MDPIPSPAAAAMLPQRPFPEGEAGGYQQMQLAALLHSLRPDAPMART